MFLALDIGNTHVKAGCYDGQTWHVARFAADADWTEALGTLVGSSQIKGAGVGSVVPALTRQAQAAVRAVCGLNAVVVDAAMRLPFQMGYATPETLGADRLAAAAAAWLQFGRIGDEPARAVLALDAGTAVTTEVVSRAGVYLGGAIAPGPDLLRRALASGTAQLPEVNWPETLAPIGTTTQAALAAGLSVLFCDGVRGLLSRTAEVLDEPPVVVATGGWAGWLARHLDGFHHVAPHLVLDGIRLLAESVA